MERIRIIGLEKSFGVNQVFSNVSFELAQGERLGLVGPNGAGKSTLLKCILGLEEKDGGQVVKSSVATIGYLRQDVDLGDASLREEMKQAWADVHRLEEQLEELTEKLAHQEATEADLARLDYLQNRLEWLGGYEYEQQTKRIVLGLGFSDEDLDKPASAFSGGQKTRINLAKALVRQPDFLFLDEPTNHLDMDMLDWLESYLLSYKGGILVVSHDRYFLDRIVTGVVELDHHKTTTYRGNYSRYIKQRDERYKADLAAYEKQQEHIRKTEEYIDKYRAGIKSKMARGRQSQLNRLERLEAPVSTEHLSFTFPDAPMSADKVLVLDQVTYGYDAEHPVFSDLSFVVRRGEAVALIGANGAGKSTLVKSIVGDLIPQDGIIDIGNRVQVGYFSQEHEELHDKWEIIDEIVNNFGYTEEKARNVLGSFLFRGDDVFKKVGDLSGGEKARLALLKLFLQGNNFLILDEPTNHLDIPTREVVEKALKEFTGTCFVISHDRYFLDQVATRILYLDHGQILDYHGNYSDFKDKLAQGRIHLPGESAGAGHVAGGSGNAGPSAHGVVKASAHDGVTTNTRKGDGGDTSNAPDDQIAGALSGQNDIVESGLSATDSASADAGKTSTENKASKPKPNDYMREKKLAQVETDIARTEATIKMYEVQLMNPAVQADADELARIAKEMEEANAQLEDLYEKWEALSE